MKKVTIDVEKTTQKLELEVKADDVTELLQFNNKILMDEVFLFMSEESRFLRKNLLLVHIVEVKTEVLDCNINLVEK